MKLNFDFCTKREGARAPSRRRKIRQKIAEASHYCSNHAKHGGHSSALTRTQILPLFAERRNLNSCQLSCDPVHVPPTPRSGRHPFMELLISPHRMVTRTRIGVSKHLRGIGLLDMVKSFRPTFLEGQYRRKAAAYSSRRSLQ